MNRDQNSASERESPACLLLMTRLSGCGVCCFLPSPLLLLLLLSSAAGSGGYVGMRAGGGSSRAGWVWGRWLWSESPPARLGRASPGTRAPSRFRGTSPCFLALVATPGSIIGKKYSSSEKQHYLLVLNIRVSDLLVPDCTLRLAPLGLSPHGSRKSLTRLNLRYFSGQYSRTILGAQGVRLFLSPEACCFLPCPPVSVVPPVSKQGPRIWHCGPEWSACVLPPRSTPFVTTNSQKIGRYGRKKKHPALATFTMQASMLKSDLGVGLFRLQQLGSERQIC